MKKSLKVLDLHLNHAENAARANPDKYTYMVEALKEIRQAIEIDSKFAFISKIKRIFNHFKIKLSIKSIFNVKKFLQNE